MTRFIFSDLRRLWLGSVVVVLLIAFATALGVAVTLQERALRLGSARAADRFDLVVGAPGSETQLLLSSVFLQPSPLPLMSGDVLGKLASDPRVSWAAPVGFGDSFSGYPIVGTSMALVGNLSAMREGRMFSKAGEAVIGAAVTLPLGYEVKPTHGLAALGGETHTELAYRITGRMAPTGTSWDRAILVPIQSVWSLHGMGGDGHSAEAEGTAEEPGHDAHAGHAHAHVDPDAPIDEHWTAQTPGLPAILVKPKTIADAYKLRQDYRGNGTLAVFPGEVLTNLYGTLGDAKRVLSAVAVGAQILVAVAVLMVTVMHIGQRPPPDRGTEGARCAAIGRAGDRLAGTVHPDCTWHHSWLCLRLWCRNPAVHAVFGRKRHSFTGRFHPQRSGKRRRHRAVFRRAGAGASTSRLSPVPGCGPSGLSIFD